jgi:hypothetical protein
VLDKMANEGMNEIIDLAKLVGGELSKIDKMSSSDNKLPQACKLDINKIISKTPIEEVKTKNSSNSPALLLNQEVKTPLKQLQNTDSLLEELIKMNQKFDLLLGFFQKKKKRRKAKQKVMIISSNGQPSTNNNP